MELDNEQIFSTMPTTLLKPSLFLKRLVILAKGRRVYDQAFHEGVNIIRGNNSAGKSTISEFIFFALGGDFVNWKPEALRCDTVIAEVEINGGVATLRREVTTQRNQPVDVYWGGFEEAVKSAVDGWRRFPLSRSKYKESYTQTMFSALGFPEVQGAEGSNITMHQVLRLATVDQMSNVHSLMREEPFDAPLTRRTVADLIFGTYDDILYQNELKVRELRRQKDEAAADARSIREALSNTGLPANLREVAKHEEEVNASIVKLRNAIRDSSQEESSSEGENRALEEIRSNLTESRRIFDALRGELDRLESEIADSDVFVATLASRLEALEESAETEKTLGDLFLKICPECLQPLQHEVAEGHCRLCTQAISSNSREGRMNRMRQELVSQIGQSTKAQQHRKTLEFNLKAKLEKAKYHSDSLQSSYNLASSIAKTPRNTELDIFYERLGNLTATIELISLQRHLLQKVDEASGRVGRLTSIIASLENEIQDARKKQAVHQNEADSLIEEIIKYFLNKDLGRESAFVNAQNVTLNFEKNMTFVDGRSNFSASSITYLNAASHFAILFASLKLGFFRYPRILVNDNIEDKGMEEKRSQNLQRLVVNLSKESVIKHQIIFTTSMIADDLNNDDYCIGPFYDVHNKTLKIDVESD